MSLNIAHAFTVTFVKLLASTCLLTMNVISGVKIGTNWVESFMQKIEQNEVDELPLFIMSFLVMWYLLKLSSLVLFQRDKVDEVYCS